MENGADSESGGVMATAITRSLSAPSEESMIALIFIMLFILMLGTLHGVVLRIRGEV